ncbi:TA system antitoxin ParD family protein [Roseateles sp. LYH14W]|uniref:ParD-like family protein n=1 Tax=Pelomonas parva TaxID=3299032 RepID=A0ABW7F5T1_9BURK
MAKSVRITDELYGLVEKTGASMSRSLAQQLEHWARIGAALDASGLTTDQVLKLMGRDNPLAEQVLAMMLVNAHKHRGAAEVVKRHAADEAAVRVGRKQAEDLFVFPTGFLRNARTARVSKAAAGAGW